MLSKYVLFALGLMIAAATVSAFSYGPDGAFYDAAGNMLLP